ncbi:MAG: hypothetical protein ACFFB0_10755 [Promethearchaeota archaeon]
MTENIIKVKDLINICEDSIVLAVNVINFSNKKREISGLLGSNNLGKITKIKR